MRNGSPPRGPGSSLTVFDIKDEMAMSLKRSMGNTQSPNFFAEMGELIAHSGHEAFADHMLHLVSKWVPIHLVDLSEWTLDELRDRVLDIKLLGSAGQKQDLPPPLAVCQLDDHPLLLQMLSMQDPLLIQMNARPNSAHPRGTSHQCNLVSRQGNRRCVISFYRPPTQRGVFPGRVVVSQVPVGHAAAADRTPRPRSCARRRTTSPSRAIRLLEQSQLQREFL